MPDTPREPRDELLVRVDSRGRISLVRVGLPPDTYVMAKRSEDGTITLTPVDIPDVRT